MIDGIRVVDAHQHLWNLDSGDYSWLSPALGPINRSFDASDAEPLAAAAGVDDVVLVQAAATIADTEAMIAAADTWSRVAGIVAWAPLADHDALPGILERWTDDPRIVGIRHLMHDEADPDWVVREDVGAGLSLLERHGLSFDVVAVLPRHLEHVPTLARRHPELRIIIDHLAKPPIGSASWDPWSGLLAEAAAFPNVSAKISGLDTACDPANYTADAIQPYIDHALTHFGAARLMFGSDWPVSVLAGGYQRWWSTVRELLAALSPAERGAILGGTARSVYRLGNPA